MTNYRRYRWICYVLALVMAFTCTSVGVFANPNGEGDQNAAPEVVENEVEAFDDVEGTDNNETGATEVTATPAPINVNVVWDEESNTYVVTWDAVEGADKYVIEYGELSQDVTETSFPLETYNGDVIKVQAYIGEKLVAEGIFSDDSLAAAETAFAAPELEQVTMNIRSDKYPERPQGDKWTDSKGKLYERVVDKPITITWEAYPGAASYNIERMSSDAFSTNQSEWDYNGQWWTIKEGVKKTKYVDNTRTAAIDPQGKQEKNTDLLAGNYTYRIVPVDADGNVFTDANGEVIKSDEAVTEKPVPNFIFTGTYKNLIWHIKAKKKTKLYKSRTGSSAKLTVPKDSKGTIKTRRPYRSKVSITVNGKTYTGWMIRKQIGPYKFRTGESGSANVRSAEITDRDYTKTAKEKYANTFAKKTKYFIWVSRYTQKINIFEREKVNGKYRYKLVRVCECSTGSYLNYTGTMTKKITSHLKTKNKSSYKYNYLSYFWKTNSLHGACYATKNKDGFKKGELKKSPSDKTSTLGCVRTWPDDAYFIYYTCGKARVRVYY